MVLLLLLASVRGAFWACEQPVSSNMTCFPYITYIQKVLGDLWQYTSLYDSQLSELINIYARVVKVQVYQFLGSVYIYN